MGDASGACGAMEPRGVMALWVYTRSMGQRGSAAYASGCDDIDVYTQEVKHQLLAFDEIAPNLTAASKSRMWSNTFQHLCDKVMGVILVRPLWTADIRKYLEPYQVVISDYWNASALGTVPLFFMEVLEYIAINPTVVQTESLRAGARSLFFPLSTWSCARMMASNNLTVQASEQPRAVQAIFNDWQAKWCPERKLEATVAMAMPVPHGMFVLSGRWQSYAFPMVRGVVARGLNLHSVAELTRGVDLNVDLANVHHNFDLEMVSLSPSLLLNIADLLRKEVVGSPSFLAQPELREDVDSALGWLSEMRHRMVRLDLQRNRKAFEMTFLINCLNICGYMKSGRELQAVLVSSLDCTVQDPLLASHFKELLEKPGAIPTTTTLYRHRLTVAIAFCVLLQHRHAEMISTDGGIVRWGTMDGSPQGNWDLILHGSATMCVRDLPAAYTMASMLNGRGPAPLDDEEDQRVRGELSKLLVMTQGQPAAVGRTSFCFCDSLTRSPLRPIPPTTPVLLNINSKRYNSW